MPNHVCNTIKFIGKAEDVNDIIFKIRSNETLFDFNKLIPQTNEVIAATVEENKNNDCRYTAMSRKEYDWNVENWGTKWNSYSSNYRANAEPTLVFHTAWSDPQPVFLKLSKDYPNVIINTYAEDEGCCYIQQIVYQNGNIIFSSFIDGSHHYTSDTISANSIDGYTEEEVNKYYKKVDPSIQLEVNRICAEANSGYTLRNPIEPINP